MSVIPPFLWSRFTIYHPIWRGIEALVCYAAVALIVGGIFSLESGTRWSVLSGLWAGGSVWSRLASLIVMASAFILAAIWGSKTAHGTARKKKSKSRKK
ncbi:MAG: hypothetical protein A2W01_11785 [Candidatus Solincola sediminis]|uniref:Uncharacterized protein n=1 Tax=Candidatus Solincola sediminis TaxID=1797199 RepID=A0A1F2WTB7_9ACTN|nr:MAG: hypothetical protein A2Y75_02380 [Candidatus Solincola sediminis]OFW60865.1 MAG: hypothetical protein A2W01_11785 [Candidatus Solincola sediminis]